jgi:hypothetical protein
MLCFNSKLHSLDIFAIIPYSTIFKEYSFKIGYITLK